MSWIDKIIPSGVRKTDTEKRANVPEGLWRKCAKCDSVLYRPDLSVTPKYVRSATTTCVSRRGVG